MSEAFDVNQRVLVVENSASVRMELISAIRTLGFAEVVGATDIVDALRHLEKHRIDWVVTSLFSQGVVNALHLLERMGKDGSLAEVRVSLLVEPNERRCLPEAFARGLLSCHPKVINRAALAQEFRQLHAARKPASPQGDLLVAAEYLRASLREEHDAETLLELEHALAKRAPQDPASALRLVEAFLSAGKRAEGIGLLDAVVKRFPESAQDAGILLKRHGGAAGNGGTERVPNRLGISSCVIVDSDPATHAVIGEALHGLGVKRVMGFADGDEAWEWIKNGSEPDLVIQEWRIPGCSGPHLVQRIRSLGFRRTVVMVVSSLIKVTDVTLLREMGVANAIMKPLRKAEIEIALAWTMSEEHRPSEPRSQERSFLRVLEERDLNEAGKLLQTYLKSAAVKESAKRYLAAEYAFATGDCEKAVQLISAALDDLPQRDARMLGLLARCHAKLGKTREAAACLEEAAFLSPENLERLCALALHNLETGNSFAAKGLLQRASALDARNEGVIRATARLALEEGDLDEARRLADELTSPGGLVAYMNARALALVRSGGFQAGIELYRRVLEMLPPQELELRARILYNLGLAHIRANELEVALKNLHDAARLPSRGVRARVEALSESVRKAIAAGVRLVFSAGGSSGGAQDSAEFELSGDVRNAYEDVVQEILEPTSAQPQEEAPTSCLRGVFRPAHKPDPFTKALLQKVA